MPESIKARPPRDPERLRTLGCAFLLPCVLLVSVLAATGVFPFGEKSLLIIDMNSEYVDYLAQMNESVRTGGSLLRTWNMGMGLGMLGLIAFYTSSPFNLLVMALPAAYLTEAILAVTTLKIGLAGLGFAAYTDYALGRRGLFAVTFSTAYALCGYTIAYASNIMWLDGVAFLPIVLLGVEKILRENRYGVFLGGLVYVFFTSYYMIGMFSFLYFTCMWFRQPRPVGEYLRRLARFLGTAAVAAGLCAFLLLPAFLGLRDGQRNMWEVDLSFALEKSFVRMASRMLPGVYDTLTDSGYPNIYCTVLGVLFCACFFAHRSIPRREKLVLGGLLGFLALSFSSAFLDLAWHAFEEPTWFPARYSFLFCFWVLYLAMRAAGEGGSLSGAAMAGSVLLVGGAAVIIGVERYRRVTLWSVGAAILLAGGYGLLWLLGRGKKRQLAAAAALFLVCGELWANALVMERGLDREFGYKTRASYTQFRERYAPAVAAAEALGAPPHRTELVAQRNANGGMALGYNGISHYSTTTDQNLNAFLRRLGYNKGTINELRFAPATPLTNGLLGIRYLLAEEEMGPGYRPAAQAGEVLVLENRCAFPLAFWTEGAAFAPEEEGDPDPFLLQNRWMESLGLGDSFFTPLSDVEELPYNANREQMEGHILYTPRVYGEPAGVEFVVHNPTGQEAYAYFPVWNNRFASAEIHLDGRLLQQDLGYRKNAILSLGAGETVSVAIELGRNTARIQDFYFYTLNLEGAAQAAEVAGEHALEFQSFGDTALRGRVTAPRDGLLATTIPADRGWRVRVDGRPVEPETTAGVFLALPLSAGEHQIAMTYRPPGFLPGCAVTAATGTGLALAAFWRRRRARAKLPPAP